MVAALVDSNNSCRAGEKDTAVAAADSKMVERIVSKIIEGMVVRVEKILVVV